MTMTRTIWLTEFRQDTESQGTGTESRTVLEVPGVLGSHRKDLVTPIVEVHWYTSDR